MFKSVRDTNLFKRDRDKDRSEKYLIVREYDPKKVIGFVANYINIDKRRLTEPYKRESTEGKALLILLLNRYCDVNTKDICKLIGNISQSRVSALCSIGARIIDKEERYKNIIDDFIKAKVI